MFSNTNIIAKIILIAFILSLIPPIVMTARLHHIEPHTSSALRLKLIQYCTYLVVIAAILSIMLSLCYSASTLLVSLILILGAILFFVLIIIWSKKFCIEKIFEQKETGKLKR